MKEGIQKIIEANLPKQVGEVLQKRLQELEEKEEQLIKANELISKQSVEISELTSRVTSKEHLDKQYEVLEVNLAKLVEDKRNLKVEKLEFQLASERDKTQFSKEVALGLVRNTEFRKTVFDSENQEGYYDGNGNWVQPNPVNKNLTETKTEE